MRMLSARRDGWSAAAAGAGPAGFAAWLATVLGAATGCIAVAAGGVLFLRRLVVAFGDAAPPVALLSVAVAGVALVALADVAWRLGGPWAAVIATRAGIVLGVAAVALPLRPTTWLEGAALTLAVAIAAAAVLLAPRRAGPSVTVRAAAVRPGTAVGRRRSRRPPGHLRQRFARYETPAGNDHVRGRIVVAIASAARTGHGHLGFCPAFEITPTVTVATDYDGVEATVAAAEVLPWGVRVEVRLTEPAEEPLEIPVDVVASSRS